MQPSNVIEVQRRIVHRLSAELPNGWSSYELHYENFNWNSERMEKYTSECVAGGKAIRFDPSLDAIDMLVELQEGMAAVGPEIWSSVECRLSSDGRFTFHFGYGIPPLVADSLRSAGELR